MRGSGVGWLRWSMCLTRADGVGHGCSQRLKGLIDFEQRAEKGTMMAPHGLTQTSAGMHGSRWMRGSLPMPTARPLARDSCRVGPSIRAAQDGWHWYLSYHAKCMAEHVGSARSGTDIYDREALADANHCQIGRLRDDSLL
ncbi:hypothetical protein BCR44DRAFT_1438607, partial [Catenaria anguillulae PL171]